MKSHTTYPTRPPHWIDEDAEASANKRKSPWHERLGISFPVAFAIVLALHLCVLGGIFATNSLKPHKQAAGTATVPHVEGPRSDALAKNQWPQPEATPEVKALPPAPTKKPLVATQQDAAGQQQAPAKPSPVVVATPKPLSANPSRVVAAIAPKPAAKASTPPAVAKATPAAKPDATALREQFLATKKATQPAPAVTEVRQALPVAPKSEPLVATNAETIQPALPVAAASLPTPIAQPANIPAPDVTEYTLNRGDNLYSVSRRLQVSYGDLMEANGITDPSQLRIGQKLKVPDRKVSML